MKFLTLAVIAALGFVGLAQNDRETRRKEALEKAQKKAEQFMKRKGIEVDIDEIDEEVDEILERLPPELQATKEEVTEVLENLKNFKKPETQRLRIIAREMGRKREGFDDEFGGNRRMKKYKMSREKAKLKKMDKMKMMKRNQKRDEKSEDISGNM